MSTSITGPLPLKPGKETRVIKEAPTIAGTIEETLTIDSDTVLITAGITTVAGSIKIEVFGLVGDLETLIIDFPSLTSPTLILKKAALSPQRIKVKVTYTDACDYEIRAKAIATGSADVTILSSSAGTNFSTTIGTTAALIIPVAVTDRVGTSVYNNNATGIVYVGFTSGVTIAPGASAGTPIKPGSSMGIDIASGVTLYGIADSGTIDVRVMEVGS